ncbi:hypothetical protein [Flavobacterium humi]|uniref:Uncharacterized protein n=1 Tax=Flavobacterium humi TaxID=2562683 RepID=A0A4Z0LA52_9FLAO|nr:hypothetical protein [Flavobacterium humi]TGD59221.1 hypothetical protein E4635_05045 [Flavobacterium humi]
MKNFLVFILILASKSIFACGFYPYGEELRYSFLNPDVFEYYGFASFNYSANTFEPKPPYRESDTRPNEVLWKTYCKNKVPVSDIGWVLYESKAEDIHPGSKNQMLRYLYQAKDYEAIHYLKFAKDCEEFNTWMDDPWERDDSRILPQRTSLLKKAMALSGSCTKEEFKIRYTFLAIRIAFYNQDFETIRKLYDTVFKLQQDKNILTYWSLYFRTMAETDAPLANFYAAQVFKNAPDKRFMIAQQYATKIPIASVLKFAKTDQEKANVYLLAAIKTHDKSLDYLKEVYRLNPKEEGLGFLLLREINKMEDWVFTPYYSLFNPSIETNNYWDKEEASIRNILKRVEADRAYAKKVLAFVAHTDSNKMDNPILWKACRAHLLFMTKDYRSGLSLVEQLEKTVPKNEALFNQLEIMKALHLIAGQKAGHASIPEEAKPIILKNKGNNQFLFALGRELEYKGNTIDAALLYSKIDDSNLDENHQYYNAAYWKTMKNKGATYADFFTGYFDYIDAVYTPEQVESLIGDIAIHAKTDDAFFNWKYGTLRNEMQELQELLGTKYIRQNKLEEALASFQKVGGNFWNEKYSAWEKNQYAWDGSNVFDKNPFYELKYTPAFIPIKDTIHLNKTEITAQLLNYLRRAGDTKEKDRDYYYFLVANCYYNMTQYGNSWMMRRYFWSSTGGDTVIEDEAEYYQCNLARKYYLSAMKNAKTEKFKMLCLRMLGRCEKNRLQYKYQYDYKDETTDYEAFIFGKNKFYSTLQSKNPLHFEALTGNCTYFEDYFRSRR